MRLWEILVPCNKNEGGFYTTRHHREWDRQVERVAGGLTILRPAVGKWRSPENDLYTDRMIPVRIACTNEQMDEIIQRTLQHYPDQEAIFAYVISDEVRIVYRDENRTNH
jgi:hypothetical protein